MVRLTTPMRDALKAAIKQPLRRVHTPGEGKPAWPAHPSTIAALLRHDLIVHAVDRDRKAHRRETWTITDHGRQALEPPQRQRSDRPRFLQRDIWRGGDYTTDPTRRIDDLECLVPAEHWADRATVKRAAASDRRAAARQLTRNARAAA